MTNIQPHHLPLDDLAIQINAEHSRALATAEALSGHVMRIGRLLAKAKAAIPHGGWLSWIESNLTISPRQVSKYLRIYAGREVIEANTNRNCGSDLTIAGALSLLTPPEKKAPRVRLAGAIEEAARHPLFSWVRLDESVMEMIRSEIDDPLAEQQRALEYRPMSEPEWAVALVRCNEWAKANGRPMQTLEELAAEYELPLAMVLEAAGKVATV